MSIVSNGQITITDLSDGKDGVGIQNTDITYANSTSGTTAPTTGWTSSVPTLVKGQYLWTKTVWTYTDTSTKTGYSVSYNSKDGTNGTNGTSGIIVSSVAPASPQNGQLWQDTSTTPQLVKKWTGSSWVIWELYVENMNVNNLSALSPNLGNITGGSYTSWTVSMDPGGNPILNGIYMYDGRLRSVSIANPISTDPKAVGGIVNSIISGMEMFGGYTDYYHGEYAPVNGTAEDMIKGANGMSFWSQLNDTAAYVGRIVGFQLGDDDPYILISTPRLLVNGSIHAGGSITTSTTSSTSFAIGYGALVTAKRVGDLVTITFRGSNTNQLPSGANPNEMIPLGYRPVETESVDFLVTGRHLDTYYYFDPDGKISYKGETVPANSYFRGVRSYFTDDPWPA